MRLFPVHETHEGIGGHLQAWRWPPRMYFSVLSVCSVVAPQY
jgi:hypothetical protein